MIVKKILTRGGSRRPRLLPWLVSGPCVGCAGAALGYGPGVLAEGDGEPRECPAPAGRTLISFKPGDGADAHPGLVG